MMKRINYKKRAVIHGLSMAVFLGACLGLQANDNQKGASAQATVNTDRSSTTSSTDPSSDRSFSSSTGQNANSKLSHADTSFIKEAAEGGIMETKVGQLAKDHASNQDVKNYGEMLVKDHSKANERLTQIASAKGVNLAKEMEPKTEKMVKDLENKSGADFDRAFIQDAIKDHRKDIAKFERASRDLSDSELKSFATETLPTLRNHLAEAERIAKSMGVNVTARNLDYKENAAAETAAAESAGAPGLAVGSANSSVNRVDVDSNIDANNKDRNPGGRVDIETTTPSTSTTLSTSPSVDANANTTTRSSSDKTLGIETRPGDSKVLGVKTEPNDGKTLGLNTRKDDGKLLGFIPWHKKSQNRVDVDVDKTDHSVEVNANAPSSSVGAPATTEKGSADTSANYSSDKSAKTLSYNDLPAKVQDTIKSRGGSTDVKNVKKHTMNGKTVYTVKLNTGTLRISEDGTVLKDTTTK